MKQEGNVHVYVRWRNTGRGERGYQYLAVSEYLRFSPAWKSGRYLIVIASMERTEAVPVRKFLIYLVFLCSLLLPSPPLRFRRALEMLVGGI